MPHRSEPSRRRTAAKTCLFGLVALTSTTVTLAATDARAAGPIGEVVATCDGVAGWSLDPDAPDAVIDVHLYFDGPAGDPGAVGLALTAGLSPPGCRGQACGHSFHAALPLSRLDGQSHPVYAYGIDISGDPNQDLSASPAAYTCPPLPIVTGVRRHIANPATLDAWRHSIFYDLMKVSDLALAAAPVGPVIDAPPTFVTAEGDASIWLLDQGFRRPVADAALAAWRFTPADAAPIADAALAALPEGTPLPPRPILVQGSGAAVFLVDDRQCLFGDPDPACPQVPDPETTSGDASYTGDSADSDTTDSPTSTSTTAADESTTGASEPTDSGPAATDSATTSAAAEDSGCACHTPSSAATPYVGAWSLALLLVRRRRRARTRPHDR